MPVNFAKQITAYLLRPLLLFLVVILFAQTLCGQEVVDSPSAPVVDTVPTRHDTPVRMRTVPAVTTPRVDTVRVVAPEDTIQKNTVPAVATTEDSVSMRPWLYVDKQINDGIAFIHQILSDHPYFGFASTPVVVHSGLKQFQGKEMLFYGLIGLLLVFAALKEAFPKYLSDLFRLLFRTTLKQKQIREQLIQSPLPSLLLNVLFVVSGGLYINILLHYFGVTPVDNFWLQFFYCMIGLAVIYTAKFAGLKVSGWLFNMQEAAETYIFIVFLINKAIGIFLLPFIVLLSFMQGTVHTIILALSWCGLAVLFLYRFLFTYASVRNQVKFNPFHFLLYIIAFEIAPLLLIYKALLFFFR